MSYADGSARAAFAFGKAIAIGQWTRHQIWVLYFTVILFTTGIDAWAQPPLPPTTDPGRIQQPFDNPVENPATPADEAQLPEIRGAAPRAPANLTSATFRLKEIRLDGATALPSDPWFEQARPYIGRRISGDDIFELARRLTALYRQEDYILSQVIVPPQSLADGVLTLQVVEGYIADVNIGGDAVARDMLVKIGEKIKASRPLRGRDLEHYLLLANDLPGVRLRSVLSPSETPGAADLTLIANVHKVESFALPSVDNYGSRYLGPTQVSTWATINQPFNANDELRVTGIKSENSELGYWQLAYSQVLNAEGFKLSTAVSRARTQPGHTLEAFDVRGRADGANVSISYPLLRSRDHSFSLRATYDHRDVETEVLGLSVIEDQIRALRLGATLTSIDASGGNNVLDIEVSRGVGGSGQDDLLKSRADANDGFSKLNIHYQRYQSFGNNVSLTIGIGGQWTDEPLLSSEQYALGGRRFGRAYEPAELSGDSALAFRIEPVYTVRGEGNWFQTNQLYGFYDVGRVWSEASGGTGKVQESLASAGLGARFFMNDHISLSVEVAQPLTKPVASYQVDDEGDDLRFFGAIQMHF